MNYSINKFNIKKKFKKNTTLIFSLFFCIFLIFIDQLIKGLIINKLNLYGDFVLIKNVVNLTYVKNYGAAFSIFFNKTKFLILFTILIIIFFIIYIFKNNIKDKFSIFSISIIISGGIGNLIDRIFKGYVIDYINLLFWPFENFAIFNFADCLIVFGSILFLISFIKKEFFKDKKIKRI